MTEPSGSGAERTDGLEEELDVHGHLHLQDQGVAVNPALTLVTRIFQGAHSRPLHEFLKVPADDTVRMNRLARAEKALAWARQQQALSGQPPPWLKPRHAEKLKAAGLNIVTGSPQRRRRGQQEPAPAGTYRRRGPTAGPRHPAGGFFTKQAVAAHTAAAAAAAAAAGPPIRVPPVMPVYGTGMDAGEDFLDHMGADQAGAVAAAVAAAAAAAAATAAPAPLGMPMPQAQPQHMAQPQPPPMAEHMPVPPLPQGPQPPAVPGDGVTEEEEEEEEEEPMGDPQQLAEFLTNAAATGSLDAGAISLMERRFRGVSWAPDKGRWRATLRIKGQKKHVGYFVAIELAARAYDRVLLALCGGGDAPTNFPVEDYAEGSESLARIEAALAEARATNPRGRPPKKKLAKLMGANVEVGADGELVAQDEEAQALLDAATAAAHAAMGMMYQDTEEDAPPPALPPQRRQQQQQAGRAAPAFGSQPQHHNQGGKQAGKRAPQKQPQPPHAGHAAQPQEPQAPPGYAQAAAVAAAAAAAAGGGDSPFMNTSFLGDVLNGSQQQARPQQQQQQHQQQQQGQAHHGNGGMWGAPPPLPPHMQPVALQNTPMPAPEPQPFGVSAAGNLFPLENTLSGQALSLTLNMQDSLLDAVVAAAAMAEAQGLLPHGSVAGALPALPPLPMPHMPPHGHQSRPSALQHGPPQPPPPPPALGPAMAVPQGPTEDPPAPFATAAAVAAAALADGPASGAVAGLPGPGSAPLPSSFLPPPPPLPHSSSAGAIGMGQALAGAGVGAGAGQARGGSGGGDMRRSASPTPPPGLLPTFSQFQAVSFSMGPASMAAGDAMPAPGVGAGGGEAAGGVAGGMHAQPESSSSVRVSGLLAAEQEEEEEEATSMRPQAQGSAAVPHAGAPALQQHGSGQQRLGGGPGGSGHVAAPGPGHAGAAGSAVATAGAASYAGPGPGAPGDEPSGPGAGSGAGTQGTQQHGGHGGGGGSGGGAGGSGRPSSIMDLEKVEGCLGVFRVRTTGMFRVYSTRIMDNGERKKVKVGEFGSLEEAAHAYDGFVLSTRGLIPGIRTNYSVEHYMQLLHAGALPIPGLLGALGPPQPPASAPDTAMALPMAPHPQQTDAQPHPQLFQHQQMGAAPAPALPGQVQQQGLVRAGSGLGQQQHSGHMHGPHGSGNIAATSSGGHHHNHHHMPTDTFPPPMGPVPQAMQAMQMGSGPGMGSGPSAGGEGVAGGPGVGVAGGSGAALEPSPLDVLLGSPMLSPLPPSAVAPHSTLVGTRHALDAGGGSGHHSLPAASEQLQQEGLHHTHSGQQAQGHLPHGLQPGARLLPAKRPRSEPHSPARSTGGPGPGPAPGSGQHQQLAGVALPPVPVPGSPASPTSPPVRTSPSALGRTPGAGTAGVHATAAAAAAAAGAGIMSPPNSALRTLEAPDFFSSLALPGAATDPFSLHVPNDVAFHTLEPVDTATPLQPTPLTAAVQAAVAASVAAGLLPAEMVGGEVVVPTEEGHTPFANASHQARVSTTGEEAAAAAFQQWGGRL